MTQSVSQVEFFLTEERPELAEYVLRYIAGRADRYNGLDQDEVMNEWTLCDGINWIMDNVDPEFDFTHIARFFG